MVAKILFVTGERMGQHITREEALVANIVTRGLPLDWTHVGQEKIREPIDLIRAATGERTGSNC